MLAMSRLPVLFLALSVGSMAQTLDEPSGLLDRFLDRIKTDLARLPNYVCTESTERFTRPAAERPWQKVDTLRFEVAMVKERELYALPGGRFQDRPLAMMVGRGTVGTGRLGILARHVFLASTENFRYRAGIEREGRRLAGYDFDVPAQRSNYRLRSGTAESTVSFQGAFWVDDETQDLVRLEVKAYDMPESLGLAQAGTTVEYARTTIDVALQLPVSLQKRLLGEVLLPVSATLTVAPVNGQEDLNRAHHSVPPLSRRLGAALRGDECRRTRVPPVAVPRELPAGTVLELRLESSLDPASAKAGDEVRALGRVARLDVQSQPPRVHVIALEFDTLVTADRKIEFTATMQEAGPASGLLKQAKRLDPKFERHSARHLDVLVLEVQRGQRIFLWDARRGSLPKGLRMRWRVD
jgi:hypothetical protein